MKVHNNPKILAAAVLCVAMMGIAPAAVIELSPAELQAGADLIVSGTVSAMKSQWDETHSLIYTDVTVSVSGTEKGQAGNEVTVRLPGGEVDEIGMGVSDMPRFTLGEQTTLHLTRTADPSVFEVYGGYQGKTPGNPQTDHTWSHSTELHWNANHCHYYRYTISSWHTAIYNGGYRWSLAQACFDIYYAGTTTRTAPVRDNYNVVTRKNAGSTGWLAQTTTWYYTSSKHIIECDMVFNTYYTWYYGTGTCPTNAYDVWSIACHEFGHFLLLDDLYDADAREQTMYGYGAKGETKKRTLASGDIAGIRHIYGYCPHDGSEGGVAEAGIEPANAMASLQVFPNPSAGRTALSYSLPKAGPASVKVVDVSGATVLTKSFRAARSGKVSLDASALCNGIYLVRVEADDFSAEQKLVIH